MQLYRLWRNPSQDGERAWKAGFNSRFPLSMWLRALERMNVDRILKTLNDGGVDYLLIGGMNFLLRHAPELTFDVDVWVRDNATNLEKVNGALQRLKAEWGTSDKDWREVPSDWRWLQRQACFCMTTQHGALDVFREVRGLEGRYDECRAAAIPSLTSKGVSYSALSDEHMLLCQQALPEHQRKMKRVEILTQAIERKKK